MSKVYQIYNWDSLYENHNSRKLQHCSYVLVPNKQDGMGLARILSHPEGASIYGCWCLILGMLSRQTGERRGWVTENGRSTGEPLNASDLALRWRIKENIVQTALDVLSSKKVGWLNVVHVNDNKEVEEENGGLPGDLRGDAGGNQGTTDHRTEQNRTEQKWRGRFAPPTIQEVQQRCIKERMPITEAENFINHHAAAGWVMNGGKKMRSWPHAFGTWKKNFLKFGGTLEPESIPQEPYNPHRRNAQKIIEEVNGIPNPILISLFKKLPPAEAVYVETKVSPEQLEGLKSL